MNEIHLPGIKSVGVCQAVNLQPDIFDLIDELKALNVYGAFENIPIAGIGEMSVKSEIEKGQILYIVNAKFKICAPDDDAKRICLALIKNKHAFFFETMDKQKLLVGTHEKPRATVTYHYENEKNITGQRGYIVEVTYKNVHSFIVLQ